MLNEPTENLWKLFYSQPSKTDRKKKINQFENNVFLHESDILDENLQKWSLSFYFNPKDFERRGAQKKLYES